MPDCQPGFRAVLVQAGNSIGAGVVCSTKTQVELRRAAVTDKQPVTIRGRADCADPDVCRAVGWVNPPLTRKFGCRLTFADLGNAVISKLRSRNAVFCQQRTGERTSGDFAGVQIWDVSWGQQVANRDVTSGINRDFGVSAGRCTTIEVGQDASGNADRVAGNRYSTLYRVSCIRQISTNKISDCSDVAGRVVGNAADRASNN